MLSGKSAALGDGANQYQSEPVELCHGEDQNRPFPALFVAFSRVKVEVQNVSPIGNAALQIASFPTGPPLSHSRSSREGLSAFREDFASNSARV